MTVTSGEVDTSAAQATAPLVIVSCDTHIGPRLGEDLRPYCPAELLDDFDAYAGELEQAAGGRGGARRACVLRRHRRWATTGAFASTTSRRPVTSTCTPGSRPRP